MTTYSRPPATHADYAGWPAAHVWTLHAITDDAALTLRAAREFASWQQFSSAPYVHRAAAAGPRAAVLPEVLPHPPQEPDGFTLAGPAEQLYPERLLNSVNPPAYLHVSGAPVPMSAVCLVGAETPSAAGIEVSRLVGMAAAEAGITLVVPWRGGCAREAARMCLSAGGKVVTVIAHGPGVPGPQDAALRTIVSSGGTVLSVTDPGQPTSNATLAAADRIAVGVVGTVVVAEAGFTDAHAAAAVKAAVAASSTLLVPAPASAALAPRASSEGTASLASAAEWDSVPYGTNARIEQRVANGYPPADLVFTSAPQVVASLRVATTQPLA